MNLIAVQLGLAVIVGTHLWLIKDYMPPDVQLYHAGINLGAAAVVAFGVFA
jgi:hypothetical protein